MQVFSIIDSGILVRKLLKDVEFDSWKFIQSKIQKNITYEIDGQNIREYYGSKDIDEYVSWVDVKPIIYEIIKGQKLPISMTIVLKLENEDVDKSFGRVINIKYLNNEMRVISAFSYSTFSLDRSEESKWDKYIQDLFDRLEIKYSIYE